MTSELVKLRVFIVDHYSLDEFRTLCFDLGVHYDALGGEGIDAKARELILHQWRQGRVADLLHNLQKTCPSPFEQAGFSKDPIVLEQALSNAFSTSTAEDIPDAEPSRDRRTWQIILRVIALLSWVLAIAWMLAEPGFEPLLAVLAGIVSLVTSFFIGDDSDRIATTDQEQLAQQLARNRRIRIALLERVRLIWIQGVLENNLFEEARMELGLAVRADAVERPWVMQLERAGEPDRVLPKGTKVSDLFAELGGSMLILGEPGSGKTFTLLELARDLLEPAERDAYSPIPLVFNLSSWAAERLPLIEWIAQELNIIYKINKKDGQGWLRQMSFHLLLDGLDEVKEEHRAACVEEINRFTLDNGLTNVVVCSRTGDYERLSKRLQLMGAIVIQPLTRQLIDDYMAAGGEKLAAARVAVETDPHLQELAQTPLTLNIIALAYQDRDLGDLGKGTVEERRQHLFAAYVQEMFTRKGKLEESEQKQAFRYLAWLAAHMQERAQSVFYIEQLHPDSLDDREWLYRAVTGLVSGLIVGLSVGLVVGLVFGPVAGLVGGLGIGLASALGLGLGEIILYEDLDFSWKRAITGQFTEIRSRMFGGLIVGLIGGLVGWLVDGIIFGLVGGLVVGLSVFIWFGIKEAVYYQELQVKVAPNQGIRLSARNALYGGLFSSLVGGLVFGLVSGLVFGLVNGLIVGLVSWLVAGFLLYGGATVIQHAILRLLLSCYRYLPIRLIDFLDAMAYRIILRKVGGGYIFIHRMLLEYFATLEDETDA